MEPRVIDKKQRDEYGNTSRSPIEDLEGDLLAAQERYLSHPDGSAEKARARRDTRLIEGELIRRRAKSLSEATYCACQPGFVDMF